MIHNVFNELYIKNYIIKIVSQRCNCEQVIHMRLRLLKYYYRLKSKKVKKSWEFV